MPALAYLSRIFRRISCSFSFSLATTAFVRQSGLQKQLHNKYMKFTFHKVGTAQSNKLFNFEDWWNTVHLGDYSSGNEHEMELSAAIDIPPSTIIARVGGDISCNPTMHTIRLASQVHLNMKDGATDSVFTRLNHSANPNLRATPKPEEKIVEFQSLRKIHAGEPLSFDYTTTEDSVLAAPFVDAETGTPIGFQDYDGKVNKQSY